MVKVNLSDVKSIEQSEGPKKAIEIKQAYIIKLECYARIHSISLDNYVNMLIKNHIEDIEVQPSELFTTLDNGDLLNLIYKNIPSN